MRKFKSAKQDQRFLLKGELICQRIQLPKHRVLTAVIKEITLDATARFWQQSMFENACKNQIS